jgi:hypothetical protein
VFARRVEHVGSYALAASSIDCRIDASSFSGLFTRVEIGHIRIRRIGCRSWGAVLGAGRRVNNGAAYEKVGCLGVFDSPRFTQMCRQGLIDETATPSPF